MRQFIGQNFLILTLVASFFAAAVLHVMFMNEMMAASQTCVTDIVQTQGCHQPEGLSCCSSEINVLQNFLQVIPQQLTKVTIAAVSAASFLPLLLLVLLYESSLFAVFQSWQKILRQRILAFHHQIGFWLKLLQKRDPARRSLWCGFKLAVRPILL